MLDPKITHQIFNRPPSGQALQVGVRPILDSGLACRVAELAARLLAESDAGLDTACAARWAWAAVGALQAAGVDRSLCVVEVHRKTATRTGPRTRAVMYLKAREFAASAPAPTAA